MLREKTKSKVYPPFTLFTQIDLFLNEILDLTHVSLLLIDVKTNLVVYANKACEDLYGFTQEELLGKPITAINVTGEANVQAAVQAVLKRYPDSYRFETLHAKKNSRLMPVEVISRMVIINDRQYFLNHIADISKQKKMQAKIRDLIRQLSTQAYRDHLTGAYNRSYLYTRYLPRLIGRDAGIIIADINCFKAINDTYGHLAGDFMLVEVVKLIASCLRNEDKIIRYGGDEFLLVLPKIQQQQTSLIAERIRYIVENSRFVFEQQVIDCSVSLGMATGRITDEQQFAALIKQADNELYRNKPYHCCQ